MNEFIYAIQRYGYSLAYLLKMVELTHQKEMQEALHFLLFTFQHVTAFPLPGEAPILQKLVV